MSETEYNFVLTQADVDSLAEKLDSFGAQLSEKERATIIGVFAAASAQIEAEAEDAEVGGFTTSPALAQGFKVRNVGVGDSFKSSLSRFTPGGIAGMGSNPVAGDSVGVTGTIMF